MRWRLKSPASRLFSQQFIQAQMTENMKAPRHWPLCGEFIGTDEFPAQRASNAENVPIWWRHHGSKWVWDGYPILQQSSGKAYINEAVKHLTTRHHPKSHDVVIDGNIFGVTGPLWGESAGHRWIQFIKASGAGLSCFLWSVPKQTIQQIMETLVIWDAIMSIMTSL